MSPSPGSSDAVAYLGPEGTFSHALAQKRYGRQSDLVPCPSIKSVFDRILSREVGSGVVPLENSSGGWIYDTVDLLIENAPRIQIHEELSLNVRLALVGRRQRSFKTIYSHFAPLKHYAKWLQKNHPGAELVACASTAQAAKMVKENPESAALTSRQAAQVYGLEVLEFPIDPEEGEEDVNVTSFVQISHPEHKKNAGEKLGLVIRLKNEPGSLVRFLRPFDEAGMNLTRIISRPIYGEPSAYHFLVEVDVRENDPSLKKALSQAEEHSMSLVSLGNYVVIPRIEV